MDVHTLSSSPAPQDHFSVLLARWHDQVDILRSHFASVQADVLTKCALELEAALVAGRDEILSAAQAAKESGYSEEHIRRVLRTNPGLNAGRTGKPAIRRRDLPRKPSVLAQRPERTYDATADARSLVSRQGDR